MTATGRGTAAPRWPPRAPGRRLGCRGRARRDPTTPMAAARTTLGSGRASSTNPATDTRPSTTRTRRGAPSDRASTSTTASTIVRFVPDTASRWVRPLRRNSSCTSSEIRWSSPSTSAGTSADGSRPVWATACRTPARTRSEASHHHAAGRVGDRRTTSIVATSLVAPDGASRPTIVSRRPTTRSSVGPSTNAVARLARGDGRVLRGGPQHPHADDAGVVAEAREDPGVTAHLDVEGRQPVLLDHVVERRVLRLPETPRARRGHGGHADGDERERTRPRPADRCAGDEHRRDRDDERHGPSCRPRPRRHAPRDERRQRQPEVVRQGVTWSRRSASVASPMPCTSSRSSTDVNGPCSARWSRIAWAVTGPMPGRVSSCSRVAVPRLMRAPAAGGPPAAGPAGCGCAADDDLLAVGEDARHVERGGVDLAAHAAGLGDRLVHPRPGRERDDARALHLAHDVDDELAGRVGDADADGASAESETASGEEVRGRSDSSHQVSSTPAATAMVTRTRT